MRIVAGPVGAIGIRLKVGNTGNGTGFRGVEVTQHSCGRNGRGDMRPVALDEMTSVFRNRKDRVTVDPPVKDTLTGQWI